MSGRKRAKHVVDKAAARCRLEYPRRSSGHEAKSSFEQDRCGLPLIASLLRYIDERSYQRARLAGQEPSASIIVCPGTVIVEYNDDGIREGDVDSLCGFEGQEEEEQEDATAELPPSGRGIRMRAPSPFFAHARQVSLQSGDYAFSFRPWPLEPPQAIDGDGTGPVWEGEEKEERSGNRSLPAHGGDVTRVTLLLREDGGIRHANPPSSEDTSLGRQVELLEPNHLLFMRQIRRMRIVFVLEDQTPLSERMFSVDALDEHLHAVTATQRTSDGLATHKSRYFVVRTPLQGTTATAVTTATSCRDSSRPADCSEVVLGFPLDAGWVPAVESQSQQQVYRFFPLGNGGFKFLLQCDLLTEVILFHPDHGPGLLDRIARAFVHASTLLQQNSTLAYVWPKYIPSQDYVTGEPWVGLAGRINEHLANPVGRMRAKVLSGGGESMASTALERCKRELMFLYLTNRQRSVREDSQNITVLDQNLDPVRPADQDVYLPGRSRYSPEDLFRPVTAGDGSREGAPGFEASFLHPEIFNNGPERPDASHPAWEQWLTNTVGIRARIRLISRAGDSPSAAFAYVAKYRHDGLLDILEQCWRDEGGLIIASPQLLNCVKQVPVPCLSGFLHPLWETYLPLEDLQRRCLQFIEPHEAFPFVDLGGQTSAGDLANKWSFLYTHLGVSRNNDLGFLLDILSYVQLANLNGMSASRCRSVIRLYCELERRCAESMEPDSLRDICRAYVEDIQGIMIPPDCGATSTWTDAKHCVWGPPSLQLMSRYQLSHMYEHALQLSRAELDALSSFFRVTLGVRCVGLQDLASELAALRDAGCRDLARVGRIYECLSVLLTPEMEQETRQLFESDPLTLVAPNGEPRWLRTSQCVWANPIGIDDRPAVGVHYGPLESLFVRTLGVGLLTIDMVYKQLLGVENHKPPFAELKSGLWLLSSLLEMAGPSSWPDATPLLQKPIFPVRRPDGGTVAVSADTDFAIVDRKFLGQHFASQVKLLDFSLEEVTLLKPLFTWAGFDQRYLSVCVSSMSFLGSDATQYPISSLSRDLCHKAHVLVRYAGLLTPCPQVGC
ncbi:hypothetical protein JDV02_000613 [Purpureocillium takamizusanense]|uniref:Uncharacterized protein n=1 Tax=Purpureocillium takamizusanense TaxID=2060973 RepID=A0A9Q8V6L4_9HYPO|nr:uncharacterized protein JDV02_000613 [Purpureocillium takamizusanense]UNI13922.1 hypothetical protein JDV02_000613 [Purpureocillium takamizusanense]